MDENARQFLERSLNLGRVVLFTGAGFSRGVRSVSGNPVPLGSELRSHLWPLAFPDAPMDESSLGEIFDVAVHRDKGAVFRVLKQLLTVDRATIPPYYGAFLRIPWYRIYTLNFDNTFPAMLAAFGATHEIQTVSALSDEIPPIDRLACVHLNGTLDDFPNITFSPPQYGERAATADQAYTTLIRDLVAQPIVFIGTQLDEPPLWQHVAMRGQRPISRELRPKSYIVIPRLPAAKAEMLDRYNIRHIPMTAEEFAETYLAPVVERQPKRPWTREVATGPFVDVGTVLHEPAVDLPDYLLGRDPTWADIREGYAVERTFESDILPALVDRRRDAVIFSGTAGSGKSTTMRRLALAANTAGLRVRWLLRESSDTLGKIRSAALGADAEVYFIDQAERFGPRGVELVRAIAETEGKSAVAAYSATALDDLHVEAALGDLSCETYAIPYLHDDDIEFLLTALERASRLGRLTGKPRSEQIAAFRERAGRQLLVAMLEATTGEKFEEKIARECDELADDLKMPYAVLAVATAERFPLHLEDLLSVVSDVTPRGLEVVDRLSRQHLILMSAPDAYVARHPVVAREVVSYFRGSGQLGEAVARLAFVLASRSSEGARSSPVKRILIRLLSHDFVAEVFSSRPQVREFYSDLEPLLRQDAHYWLQRGSYEVERGDLRAAEVFLANARGLARNDFMVETEWAYLMLEQACRNPTETQAARWFNEGYGLLLDVLDRWGARTPNTYVVLAQTAVRWVRGGRPSKNEAVGLFEVVRSYMAAGSEYHANNRQFSAAREEIDRAYLELSLIVE